MLRQVTSGTTVVLTAAPASGSLFSGWNGACGGTALTCTLKITANATAGAAFAINTNPGAPTLTDFVDMSTGADGALLTTTIASNDTLPKTGRSGVWSNGNAGAPKALFVSQTGAQPAPSRGAVQIGQTLIEEDNTPGAYRKHSTQEYDYVAYNFNGTPKKVAVGMYMYFSGAWATSAGNYYDNFVIDTLRGDFVSFNMINGTPNVFQVETGGCVANGLAIFNGNLNSWYWVAMYYDATGTGLGTITFYDATTWTPMGSGSCPINTAGANDSLADIRVGDDTQHGNPAINADYYMKSLMVDLNGVYSPSNPLLPEVAQGKVVADAVPPSMPTGLTGAQNGTRAVNLSWNASTDNIAVASYRIFRCQGAGCTPTTEIFRWTSPSHADSGLQSGTTYVYAVSALDGSGNESPQSATFSIIPK